MEEFTESLCHSLQLGHTPKIQSADGFAFWDLEANAIKIPSWSSGYLESSDHFLKSLLFGLSQV